MKPATTLKELLKPPFECEVLGISNLGCWIRIGGFDNDRQIRLNAINDINDELHQFVVQALNEKWERDFAELRWEIDEEPYPQNGTLKDFIYYCPKCRVIRDRTYDYCPKCGQRLLPPKEAQNG